MNKMIIGALALGVMASGAYAGCSATKCVGKINKLYMAANGTLYVGTDGNEKSLNCAAASGSYMSLANGDVGKNAMYSLLLTAKTTGKPVSIRIQKGTTNCRVLYVTD